MEIINLDITQIRIDRKTGKEISRKKVGTKQMTQDEYAEACCRFLTGKSTDEVAKMMMQQRMDEIQNRG